VTDPDGLQDVVGGRLVDPDTGGTYGVFTASGSAGAYTFALTWLGMQAVRGVPSAPVSGLSRDFRAEFFDLAGNVGTGTVTMLIACGLTGYGVCNNQCRLLGTSTDCAACNDAVPTGGSCFNGTPVCPAGESVCNGACVNLQTNSTHCGACNTPVPTGQVCRNGAPACATAGHTYCPAQMVCANLQTSSSHCGACGAAVQAPFVCRNGAPSCPNTTDTYCPAQNVCANLQTSTSHCGACGNAVTRGCVAGFQTPTWTSTYTSPGVRTGAAMIFDANRGVIVLFGGYDSTGLLGDTWTWNGTTWTELSLTPSPPARSGHGMAWDAARSRVVLYGGAGIGAPQTDLWELSPTGWEQKVQSGALPTTGHPPSLVYDSVRQRTTITNVLNGAVWEWDGTSWAVRPASAIVSFDGITGFDPVRNRLQLLNSNGIRVLNGSSWNLASGNGPDVPIGTIVFDTQRQRSVVLATSSVFNSSETWEWSGSQWTEMNTYVIQRPGELTSVAMAWDPLRNKVVVVGGLDCSFQGCPYNGSTWEYGR
jgi:hypothetical protein